MIKGGQDVGAGSGFEGNGMNIIGIIFVQYHEILVAGRGWNHKTTRLVRVNLTSDQVEVDKEGVGPVDHGVRSGVGVGRGGRVGGSLVGTGLVEVAHEHGHGPGEVASHLGGREVGPRGEMAGVDGGAPGGDGGGEQGGMVEGNFICKEGGGDKCIGGRGVRWCRWWLGRVMGRQMD